MKRNLFFSGVLFFGILCGSVSAENESLPAVYILLFGNPSSTSVVIPLNDTGITRGANYPDGYSSACSGGVVAAAQDCSLGRDVTHNDSTDGHAGFSFTKLGSNGTPLANQSATYANTPWSSVKDNVTGLIWEVKTGSGLHRSSDKYSWYNTDPATNGGAAGYAGGAADDDTCLGYNSADPSTYCNTMAYVQRVNDQGWGGASDWRIPTYGELQGIVSYGHFHPTIDAGYFPNTSPVFFWSGSPIANNQIQALGILFHCGNTGGRLLETSQRVRLVRSGQ